jgi:hypothetical protein|tara:strand:- start:405 stop:650 length:246 start_codon:yes stop_codon:yes gene_type:complete
MNGNETKTTLSSELSHPESCYLLFYIIMLSKIISTTARVSSRTLSTSANVWVNKDTRCIVQGFTGKQVCIKHQQQLKIKLF